VRKRPCATGPSAVPVLRTVARWQVPENWTFVAEIPKTAVGKFDKKVLRTRLADGELEVERVS
jgi:non-ribosomal peptide synthetase component E (peptide arylation enzyme)